MPAFERFWHVLRIQIDLDVLYLFELLMFFPVARSTHSVVASKSSEVTVSAKASEATETTETTHHSATTFADLLTLFECQQTTHFQSH